MTDQVGITLGELQEREFDLGTEHRDGRSPRPPTTPSTWHRTAGATSHCPPRPTVTNRRASREVTVRRLPASIAMYGPHAKKDRSKIAAANAKRRYAYSAANRSVASH
jgi:hypothetical protein